MYLSDAEIERNVLRQGDIVSGVHLAGALNLQAVKYSIDYQGTKVGWSLTNPPQISDAMVLSHSCEIDRENSVKVTSIILAPLRDISTATDTSKVEELKGSNIIKDDTKATYLKYFYVDPHDKLEHKDGAVVDFSKCFSVRKNSYDLLVGKKVLQLKEDVANSMAFKLALYFYRTQTPSDVSVVPPIPAEA